MSFQGQTPPQQGGQRTGFSSLPEGAKQALTGVMGVVIVAAIVFGVSFFLATQQERYCFLKAQKRLPLHSFCLVLWHMLLCGLKFP